MTFCEWKLFPPVTYVYMYVCGCVCDCVYMHIDVRHTDNMANADKG